MRRNAFTLIESIIALVILAAMIPTSALMLADSARRRVDAAHANRASWLASGVIEQILADVNSPSASLGMSALANASTYLNTPSTGLVARLETVTSLYADRGLSYAVTIGGLVSDSGSATGDSAQDVYRLVTVTVSWTDTSGTARSLALSSLVCDLTP